LGSGSTCRLRIGQATLDTDAAEGRLRQRDDDSDKEGESPVINSMAGSGKVGTEVVKEAAVPRMILWGGIWLKIPPSKDPHCQRTRTVRKRVP